MLFAGDITLRNVVDPKEPFALIEDLLQRDDVVYGNLEGPFHDQIDPYEYYYKTKWVHPRPSDAVALKAGNFKVLGLANNVVIGGGAIKSTIDILDKMGIAHTGAGMNLQEARAPAIVKQNGVTYGFLQRTSIYWPVRQRAIPDGEVTIPLDVDMRYVHGVLVPGDTVNYVGAPGVATIKARTAYEPSYSSMFEGGGDAIIHTWPDPTELNEFLDDVKRLRPQVDVLVTSHHWRVLGQDVARDYRIEIAHAAIDAGADLVASHGTHAMDEVEVYKGKVIFYGLGNLLFRWGKTWVPGYSGVQHPQQLVRHGSGPSAHLRKYCIVAKAEVHQGSIGRVSCMFVGPKSMEDDRPIIKPASEEAEGVEYLRSISKKFGTQLRVEGDSVVVLDA